MTAAEIAARLGAKRVGDGRWKAPCPSHDDRSPSLAVTAGREGRTLIRCYAGCELEDVLGAAGLELSDLFQKLFLKPSPTRRRPEDERHRALLASDPDYAASWKTVAAIAAKIRRSEREHQQLAELHQRLMAYRAGVPGSTAMRLPLGELRGLLAWCAEVDADQGASE